MEQNIKIKTPDNHIIYGILNYQQKTNKLIIFVHGLTGHKNEHQFYNAAKFFPAHGFTTFRFDLYSGEEKGRTLSNCNIKTHAEDLDQVVSYFKNYRDIYLVGHSLGGPSILWSSQKNIKSIVLWDPSLKLIERRGDDLQFNKKIDKYIINYGTESLLSKEMINQWRTLDNNILDCFKVPTKIICAQKGILAKSWKNNLSKIKVKTDFVIIKNAGHCFNEDGVGEKLLKETLKWFIN